MPAGAGSVTLKRTLVATLSRKDFNSLRNRFPSDAHLLSGYADTASSKVEIPITPALRLSASQALSDHLFGMASRINEEKFFSYYNQVREVTSLPRSRVGSILEIGAKGGVFNSLIKNYNYDVTTFDIDPIVGPDIVGNVLDMQLETGSYDLAACFEVLEHLPYKHFTTAVRELARVSRNYVFLSLPYSCNSFYFEFRLRLVHKLVHRLSGSFSFFSYWPSFYKDIDAEQLAKRDDKHNPHYWEIGRRSFPKKRVLADIESAGLKVVRKFHSARKPYHFFILCEKR